MSGSNGMRADYLLLCLVITLAVQWLLHMGCDWAAQKGILSVLHEQHIRGRAV